uniref:Uncharacterized protein n=1 Tax=Glossina austeni TaxID=7395 RepID=A0A1A9VUK3_GLOAU
MCPALAPPPNILPNLRCNSDVADRLGDAATLPWLAFIISCSCLMACKRGIGCGKGIGACCPLILRLAIMAAPSCNDTTTSPSAMAATSVELLESLVSSLLTTGIGILLMRVIGGGLDISYLSTKLLGQKECLGQMDSY